MQERIYTSNSGAFRKGYTPHNKGKKGKLSRDGEFCTKGHKGFLRRPVVVINPDGTVKARYDSVAQCQRAFGVRDRHTVTKAAQGKFKCRGFRIMYEEDWSPLGDYRYKPTQGRDIYGRLTDGNVARAMARFVSPEARQRQRILSRELSLRMCKDPNSKWGKPKYKPVLCLTTGEKFKSVKEAAEHYGMPRHYISGAIHRNGTTKNLKFIFDNE